MKKVLFFIPTLGGGGAEKVLVNLVNNMDSTKFDITILTLFDTGKNKIYLNSNINYKYIFKKLIRGNIHLFKLFSPKYLAHKFIRDDYDIAVSYLEGPTTRIISGIQNVNTIKINWVHSKSVRSNLVKSYRSFEELKDCYNKYNCTVFVSETAKKYFIEETGLRNNDYVVKYNTIETNKVLDQSNESINDLEFDPNTINLITVGKLVDIKGYDRLLKIIKKLVAGKLDIHLYILGEGPLEKKIKKNIETNNLQNCITLLGYKDNPYKYVNQADLFVCSSYSEGFSTAVTESLVLGTPVITTRVSGMEEMLKNNEYGLIVDNNTESLYEGLKSIISDKRLLNHYKNQAMKRSTFFDTAKTVKEVEELFLGLINDRT